MPVFQCCPHTIATRKFWLYFYKIEKPLTIKIGKPIMQLWWKDHKYGGDNNCPTNFSLDFLNLHQCFNHHFPTALSSTLLSPLCSALHRTTKLHWKGFKKFKLLAITHHHSPPSRKQIIISSLKIDGFLFCGKSLGQQSNEF